MTRHVPAVGPNLAVMEELGHDDRVRFAGGNRHQAGGVELGSAVAEGLRERAIRG